MKTNAREWVRRGGFMRFASLENWRRVEITERHPRVDRAQVIKKLGHEDYVDRERKVPVMDNPDSHQPASLIRLSTQRKLDELPSVWRCTTRASTAVG